jgi:hypothetical protein
MIQVTCACGATMQVEDDSAGKQCKCPKCGATCQIPAAAPAVEATAPAAAPPAAAPPIAAAPVATKRPGGLTALAVLNFVFGGIGAIVFLLALIGGAALSSAGGSLEEFARKTAIEAAERSGDPEAIKAAKELNKITSSGPNMGVYYLVTITGLVSAGLLITAGVGYIKQSRKKGYVFGNAYGILAIVLVILQIAALGSGFGFGTILGLAYPIITLALLNTTFKESFPNP